MQWKEFSEGDIIDINVIMKYYCDRKDGDVPETVMAAKPYTWKELLELFHDIENTNDKILNADPKF